MPILFHPAFAFVVYLALGGVVLGVGGWLAQRHAPFVAPASTYASGEAAPTSVSVPGYQPYFRGALFFALVHLGALVLATSQFQPLALVYLAGLMVVLGVLLMG